MKHEGVAGVAARHQRDAGLVRALEILRLESEKATEPCVGPVRLSIADHGASRREQLGFHSLLDQRSIEKRLAVSSQIGQCLPDRERGVVGDSRFLQALQKLVGDAIAGAVLDARRAGVERVGDVLRGAGMHDEWQLLGPGFVANSPEDGQVHAFEQPS